MNWLAAVGKLGWSLAKITATRGWLRAPLPPTQTPRGIVLASGVSGKSILPDLIAQRNEVELYVVNHAAITQEYIKLRPENYVILDEIFWLGEKTKVPGHNHPEMVERSQATVKALLEKTTWPCTLWAPHHVNAYSLATEVAEHNSLQLKTYPLIALNGPGGFIRWALRNNKGYLSPKVVGVMALQLALARRHSEIGLVGLDNDPFRKMFVDANNQVYFGNIYAHGSSDAKYRTWRTAALFLEVSAQVQHQLDRLAAIAQPWGTQIINYSGGIVQAFPRACLLPGPTEKPAPAA